MRSCDAWSFYWQQSHLESCIANDSDDHHLIVKRWQDFAIPLTPDNKVLDLATGNGFVLHSIISKRSDLQLFGVDYADIVPDIHFTSQQNKHIRFLANTDISSLPFDDNYFDAITSQFGFEYAPKDKAYRELSRVLKQSGQYQLIVHHKDSEVIKFSIKKRKELNQLVEGEALIKHLEWYSKDQITLKAFADYQQHFLKVHHKQITEQVTGQIFKAIMPIVNFKQKHEQLMVDNGFTHLQEQITAEISRLSQLIDAALNQDSLSQLINNMKIVLSEVNCEVISPLNCPEKVFAWRIWGIK
jgi:ubiquinone/menaquinone biosynthesis C-methylase UbiE